MGSQRAGESVCEVQRAGSVQGSTRTSVGREERVGAICESVFASVCTDTTVCVLVLVRAYTGGHCVSV